MRRTIHKSLVLKLGYIFFLLSLSLKYILPVHSTAGQFAEGLFTGLAIILLLAGIYRTGHAPKQA